MTPRSKKGPVNFAICSLIFKTQVTLEGANQQSGTYQTIPNTMRESCHKDYAISIKIELLPRMPSMHIYKSINQL